MNPFEMVVVIVLIAAVASVLKARYGVVKDENGKEVYLERNDNADSDRLREEVKVLKERISVLERLATDDQRNLDLDREIAKLRDHSKQ